MTKVQPAGVGTEEPASGNTFVATSMPYNNCNHSKNVKFVNSIPCVDTPADDLVVFRVVREAAVSNMQ